MATSGMKRATLSMALALVALAVLAAPPRGVAAQAGCPACVCPGAPKPINTSASWSNFTFTACGATGANATANATTAAALSPCFKTEVLGNKLNRVCLTIKRACASPKAQALGCCKAAVDRLLWSVAPKCVAAANISSITVNGYSSPWALVLSSDKTASLGLAGLKTVFPAVRNVTAATTGGTLKVCFSMSKPCADLPTMCNASGKKKKAADVDCNLTLLTETKGKTAPASAACLAPVSFASDVL